MKNSIFLLFIIVLFAACSQGGNQTVAEIEKLEKIVADSANTENSSALIEKYQEYVAANPTDHENNSKYLYRAAELQFRMNRFSGAVKFLQEALRDHFSSTNTANNALLLGTIYKEKLRNQVGERAVYQCFIDAFPNHEKTAAIKKDYGNEVSLDDKLMDFGSRLMNDSTNRIDYRIANDFIGLCEIHALLKPNNPKSADYLTKAGETARSMRSFPKALEIYDWIYSKYADHPKASQALFLKAFTYDNDLKKFEEAKVLYQEFLAKYPNDDFADDTQFLLENIGKDDEEIIKSFEKEEQ